VTDPLERLQSALADRYAIERELGRGGMAVVYLARGLKLDRPVALKVLRPELAASLGSSSRMSFFSPCRSFFPPRMSFFLPSRSLFLPRVRFFSPSRSHFPST